MDKLVGSLAQADRDLLRETEPARMDELDEDALLKLHSRVRRTRNKHSKNYRRRASKMVQQHAGRGKARPKNRRAAEKAEVFEDALSRVSRRVERMAREAAKALKAERLAMAGAKKSPGPAASAGKPDTRPPGRPGKAKKTTGGRKRDASTRAAGARRQAKRDAR